MSKVVSKQQVHMIMTATRFPVEPGSFLASGLLRPKGRGLLGMPGGRRGHRLVELGALPARSILTELGGRRSQRQEPGELVSCRVVRV